MRPGLWRHRDFLLLWGGQTVSQLGSQVTLLALPLVAIVVLKATPLEVGLLATATTCAYLLVALPAGVLADRVSKRRMMLCCNLASLVVIGSAPVAQVGGPALGALLVGLVGAARAMAGDALSFAIAAVGLLLIRQREAPSTRQHRVRRAQQQGAHEQQVRETGVREQRPRFGPELREGLSFVLHEPILRKSAAWSGTANFFVIMVETLGPLFLIRTLHIRPAYVGLLLALGALGGVVGGIVSAPLARRFGSARLCVLSMTIFSPPGCWAAPSACTPRCGSP